MRKICYSVAMTLDARLSGPRGEIDWIVADPEIDFAALFRRFDTLLMGRHTFEVMRQAGQDQGPTHDMRMIVCSRTLRQADHPDVTIIGENLAAGVANLRAQPGKDIWLFGGGSLFRSLLEARLVDRVEVAVMPALLGDGVPLLHPPMCPARLRLAGSKVFQSGIVALEYDVAYEPAADG